MSTDTVSGKFDQVVGKVKQGVGEAVGDNELANAGTADQVKGNAKEAWGHVKDAASNTGDRARASATTTTEKAGSRDDTNQHSLRDKVVQAATDAKNSVREKAEEFRGRQSS